MKKFITCLGVGFCTVVALYLLLNPLALLATGIAIAGCTLVGAVVLAIVSKLEKEE